MEHWPETLGQNESNFRMGCENVYVGSILIKESLTLFKLESKTDVSLELKTREFPKWSQNFERNFYVKTNQPVPS